MQRIVKKCSIRQMQQISHRQDVDIYRLEIMKFMNYSSLHAPEEVWQAFYNKYGKSKKYEKMFEFDTLNKVVIYTW